MKHLIAILIVIFNLFGTQATKNFGLETIRESLSGAGFGWDYLTDSSRYPLFKLTFDQNKYTSDGMYKVPDCLVSEDEKIARFSDSVEIINNANSYTSKFSRSTQGSGSASFMGLAKISGSYSEDYRSIMQEQKRTKTVTVSSRYYDPDTMIIDTHYI